MHGRGKDFEYRVVFPDGKRKAPRSAALQLALAALVQLTQPISTTQGAKIECTAHFDNSPDNPENPDPAKTVHWGDQSWDEMMVGFFNLVFDAKMPVEDSSAESEEIIVAWRNEKHRVESCSAVPDLYCS